MAKKVKPAPKTFEQQVSEMSVEELLCRVIAHAWKPVTLETSRGVFELGLACMRCRKERSRHRHWRTLKATNRYWDPPESHYALDRIGRLTSEQRRYIEREVERELKRANLPSKGKAK